MRTHEKSSKDDSTNQDHVGKEPRHVDAQRHVGDDLFDDIALALAVLVRVDSAQELQKQEANEGDESSGIVPHFQRTGRCHNYRRLTYLHTVRSSLTSPFFSAAGGAPRGAAIVAATPTEGKQDAYDLATSQCFKY